MPQASCRCFCVDNEVRLGLERGAVQLVWLKPSQATKVARAQIFFTFNTTAHGTLL